MEEINDNELTIVLPVFNEEEVIEKSIREIHEYAKHLIDKLEIIAVNDGSTDSTLSILDRLSHALPVLRVVSHAYNMGYGSALSSGIKEAKKSWVLLMDPDGQFHIDSLGVIWPHRSEYDVLLGYRLKRADSLYRLMLGRFGNTLSNLFLGHPIRDINCGFKLFKREIIYPLAITSTGGIVNFEILYRVFKKNKSVRLNQYPIKHFPRELGKAKGGRPGKIFRITLEGIKVILFKN